MAAPMELPYLILQSDWEHSLRERNGRAWVTCKISGKPSIHGELEGISTLGTSNSVRASNGFQIGNVTSANIELSHADPNCSCLFVAPRATFDCIHSSSILSMDINGGELGVSACMQEKLLVWNKSKGVMLRAMKGVVGVVYSCRFFPSGMVVLSGGADMRLKIWSVETGQCAATLTGHVAAILDTAIVERGRNVISVSRDGTSKLWDCGQGACLSTLASIDAEIKGCALGAYPEYPATGTQNIDHSDRETGTEGKLLLLACQDKKLRTVAVYHRKEVLSFSCTSEVNACKFLNANEVVCGCEDGSLWQLDLRNTSRPVRSFRDSSASILSLLPIKDGFIAGKADGMCAFYALDGDKRIQFTGSDCDPIYNVVADKDHVFTCARDGAIRKYAL